MTVQIVRFKDGLDVISNVDYTDETIELSSPMMFEIRNANLMLQHWLPLAIMKGDTVKINKSEILCVMDPNDDFSEYYTETVNKMKEILNTDKKSENILNELRDVVESMAEMEEAMDELEHNKNIKIH